MKKLTNLQIMVKKVFCCFLCLLITLPGITATQVQHPWQGKRVAYLGDSITDPKNKAAKKTLLGVFARNAWHHALCLCC